MSKPIMDDFEKGMIVGFCIMTLCMILFIDYFDLHIPEFCSKFNQEAPNEQ